MRKERWTDRRDVAGRRFSLFLRTRLEGIAAGPKNAPPPHTHTHTHEDLSTDLRMSEPNDYKNCLRFCGQSFDGLLETVTSTIAKSFLLF